MFNLYGDKNWTVRIGLWEKLRNKLATIEGQPPLNGEGQPTTDFVCVNGITADEAAWLIENLPPNNLTTVKTMAQPSSACSTHPSTFQASSYMDASSALSDPMNASALTPSRYQTQQLPNFL